MQGTTVNGYRFVSLIGRGGMAEVWKAENGLGVCFAIKVLNANFSQDPAIVERFRSEAKIMVALNHPNIRKVIDLANLSDGRPCIIMEYLEGADLASRMKRGEKFTGIQLRKWWNQMVDVLNYTHSQGVIHRDIKPSNIFINESGDVKLLDFGIARTGDGLGTRTGSNMGTLMYMSPEQVTDVSRVSKMSDVYSLAVTFVHLASGKPPYDSALTEYTIMDSIVKTPLDTTTLPEPWKSFLKPYLEKNPILRPDLKEIHLGAQSGTTTTFTPSSQLVSTTKIADKTKVDNNEIKNVRAPYAEGALIFGIFSIIFNGVYTIPITLVKKITSNGDFGVFLLMWLLCLVLSVIGIILSVKGFRKCSDRSIRYTNQNNLEIGLIMSIISFIISLFTLIIFLQKYQPPVHYM